MFADVILPLPLSDLYTYAVPAEMRNKIARGSRVIVPFGNKRYYTAIIYKIEDTISKELKDIDIKEIHSLLNSQPLVNEQQLNLWEWISFYYLSPLGDVFNAAVPSSMKSENLKSRFTPRTETVIKINPDMNPNIIREIIGKAQKQQSLYSQIENILIERKSEYISRKEVSELECHSTSALKSLIVKGVLQSVTIETSRLNTDLKPTRNLFPLNEVQQRAYKEIKNCLEFKQTCLLHGVTSSGKTEIYMHLIQDALSMGKQTLYLVPEIALTTQLTQRLQAVFGSKIGIYHSRINDNERAEIWIIINNLFIHLEKITVSSFNYIPTKSFNCISKIKIYSKTCCTHTITGVTAFFGSS
jgi:primosomal protein N' (replication factor Y)